MSEVLNDELSGIFKSSLSLLGKHPLTQRHAFLEIKLVDKQLSDLEGIRKFPLLVYVNASKNNISDLEPLSSLLCLSQLNLSENKITSCLQYQPQLCNSQKYWASGNHAIGSMLTLANLSFNLIEEIADLSHHPFLECLLLNNNKIKKISGLQNLKHLKVLDLSGNQISIIEGLDNLPIEELNLSKNKIEKVDGLANLPNLSVLNVSNNLISSLGPLVSCTNLNSLNAGYNSLQHIRQAEFLCELRWLKRLVLYGNPASKKHLYRFRVIFRLPLLNHLDDLDVAAEEKVIYACIDCIYFILYYSCVLSTYVW